MIAGSSELSVLLGVGDELVEVVVLEPDSVAEEVEEDVDRDWLEVESTLELDVDDSELDIIVVETDDIWEVLELDNVLRLDSVLELDWDDEVDTFEPVELDVAVAEVEVFDEVAEAPEGGAIA